MADLIDLKKILEKVKEKKETPDLYESVYRVSATEADDFELRRIVDDIDEVTTCLIEEVERLKEKIEAVEELNKQYLRIIEKLVRVFVEASESGDCTVLTRLRDEIKEAGGLENINK
ncbi:MAG: hypothetical protein D6713_02095 [Deltaproteobacteria bacterium]|nr:MAG: hypothetical protein D6713_02095 [Deltaproteobacteria bacterium]